MRILICPDPADTWADITTALNAAADLGFAELEGVPAAALPSDVDVVLARLREEYSDPVEDPAPPPPSPSPAPPRPVPVDPPATTSTRHERTPCPLCGRKVAPQGMPAHKRKCEREHATPMTRTPVDETSARERAAEAAYG